MEANLEPDKQIAIIEFCLDLVLPRRMCAMLREASSETGRILSDSFPSLAELVQGIPRAAASPPAVKRTLKLVLQSLLLPVLRNSSGQVGRTLWQQFQIAHPPLIQSDPPLTRAMADTFLEACYFVVCYFLYYAPGVPDYQRGPISELTPPTFQSAGKLRCAEYFVANCSTVPSTAWSMLASLTPGWQAFKNLWDELDEPRRHVAAREVAEKIIPMTHLIPMSSQLFSSPATMLNFVNNWAPYLIPASQLWWQEEEDKPVNLGDAQDSLAYEYRLGALSAEAGVAPQAVESPVQDDKDFTKRLIDNHLRHQTILQTLNVAGGRPWKPLFSN